MKILKNPAAASPHQLNLLFEVEAINSIEQRSNGPEQGHGGAGADPVAGRGSHRRGGAGR